MYWPGLLRSGAHHSAERIPMDLKDIQSKFKQLGLRDRPSQLHMIQCVFDALKKEHILCIEAPTGTGKTLSYLLASEMARTDKRKIVVSTATIALQEQLISKDLPLLERLLNKKIRYAIAKGRQNYLCLAKLYQDEEQADIFGDNRSVDYLKNQVTSQFWNGDKEELSQSVPDQEWQNVTTNSAGCSGKNCQYYEQCYFYKARNKIHTADFIITNHSLLLSDIELGAGILLPDPIDNIYIIDECHHLPQRSISHFAKTSKLLGAMEWINQINFNVQRAIATKSIANSWLSKINPSTARLVETIKQLKAQLDLNTFQFSENIWRIVPQDVAQFSMVQPIATESSNLQQYCDEIQKTLENELELLDDKSSEHFQLLAKQLTQMKFIASKVGEFATTWRLFCLPQQEKQPPIARWFEKTLDDYYCHCSPINASQQLKELLWDKIANGALLCSATVRSLGSFNNFLRKTGLKQLKQTRTETMPAIFNYKNSIIFIPKMQYEPSGNQQHNHRREAIELLTQLILPKSGTLVLFTSKSAMHETFQQLAPHIIFDVLMQGEQSKQKLIETHKKRIEQQRRSIIFGLASFAEGIDLPAEYCQHVIIHKLPFAVPSDPIELTRSEWISQHKLNPFTLATLPETSTRLTQYVGRLIRQEDDIGVVTILDRRLYSKQYGKQLLGNLPPFSRLINSSVEVLKQQPMIAELFKL